MAEAKTTEGGDVGAFLAAVQPPERQAEARQLDTLFRQATGFAPRLWGGAMVGYGRYVYRYDSGHSGVSLATGFAPRKAELVVYILPGYADATATLARLGPHRLGKSCLYLRRLKGIDLGVLEELIRAGLADLGTRWTIEPT